MISLIIPISPELAGQRLDPYRMFLVIMFVPLLLKLVMGRAGPFILTDALMLLFGAWVALTLMFHHGASRFAYASIYSAEWVGGYLAGRVLIRSVDDYRTFIRYYLAVLLVLLPIAYFEFLTSRNLVFEFFSSFAPIVEVILHEQRLGFYRTQGVFPHPILWGLFCSIALANVIYIYRDRFGAMLTRLALVVAITFTALSSAPLLSMGLQTILVLWDKVMRGRWWLLVGAFVFVYIALEFLSNRGPIILLIETLTLNPRTAWWRVHVWNFGTDNVMANPLFGLGLNDWVRPFWLADTVDNFWLLIAMRHGLPAIVLLILTLGIHIARVVRAKGLPPRVASVRTGYMIALVGMCFTLITVHAWGPMAVFAMFYIGAGSLFYTGDTGGDGKDEKPSDPAGEADEAKPSLYTRFGQTAVRKKPPEGRMARTRRGLTLR